MRIKKFVLIASLMMALTACDDSEVSKNYVAEPQDAKGLYELGKDYFSGMNVQFDRTKAVELFTKSAEMEYPQAEYMMASLYAQGNSVEKNFQKASEYYKRAAEHGILEAQVKLAETLIKDNGLIVSKEDATDYLMMASKHDPKSMTQLAELYIKGQGVEQNYKKAETLLLKAASYKEPEALLELSEIYFTGAPGILKDDYKGLNFLKIALNDPTNRDKSKVYMALGNVYLYGRGYPVDEQKAMSYFEQAAEGGLIDAQYFLGNRQYDLGEFRKALFWFMKAANSQHVPSQLRVASMYYTGTGIDKDINSAISWNEKAMINGSAQARFNLLQIYGEAGANSDKIKTILEDLEETAAGGDRDANLKLYYFYAGDGTYHNDQKADKYLQEIINLGDNKNLEIIASKLIEGSDKILVNKDLGFKLLKYTAVQGSSTAVEMLGDYYRTGNFVEKDVLRAYAWYSLMSSHKESSERIKSLKLNKKQLKEAQNKLALLKDWIKNSKNEKFYVVSENTLEPAEVSVDSTNGSDGMNPIQETDHSSNIENQQ